MSIDTSKIASLGPNPNVARNTYTREKAQSDVDALAGGILAVARSDVKKDGEGIGLTKINKDTGRGEKAGEDKTLGGMLFAHLSNIGATAVNANGDIKKIVDTESVGVPKKAEEGTVR
jgi:hypothetical protein